MQVYSYAVSLSRNRALAEDLTEETFYRAATASATFDMDQLLPHETHLQGL